MAFKGQDKLKISSYHILMPVIEIRNWAKSALGQDIALFKSTANPEHPILLMGGVHGDEPEGVQLAQDTLKWLKSNTELVTCPWIIIPCLNPDGYAKNERTNGNGVDLNRNYPSRDWSPEATKPRYNPGLSPASESEIRALVALINEVKPRLIIHCHSWNPCIVYTGKPAQPDADALGAASGYEVRDNIGYPTTGSLSQYGWHDNKIPIICVEEAEHSPLDKVWAHFEDGIKKIFSNNSLRNVQERSALSFECISAEQAAQILEKIEISHPDSEKIVTSPNLTAAGLKTIFSSGASNIKIFNSPSQDVNTQLTIVAKTHSGEINLSRAQKRTVTIKNQVEALHKALLAVHSSQSIAEVETLLYSALSKALELNWVRVFLHASEHLDEQLDRIQGQALFKSTLILGSRKLGRIVFARTHAKSFTKSEEEALNQITESVALALDRLAKLDQAETLKLQWDSTFDAISEPLCLTDEKFNILRTNLAFLKTTGLKLTQAIGANCFSVFSGRASPALTFDITTQRIPGSSRTGTILLVMFRNITEQKKIEKQIFESSKMAELGTIGSSIAHDINNPLGGMLSFLQLIKMELSSDHPLREDILEMERAGMRCKEIVENLLSFSRRQESDHAEDVDLREIIDQALKISELQTRSLGIDVEVTTPKNGKTILGHFNLLSQALSHILQNAFDAVSDKLKQNPGYNGKIKVNISPSSHGLTLTIVDNGIGISPELQSKILNPLFSTKARSRNPGLGLTLAYQIISEHNGRLDISSQPNVGTTVKISFANV